MKIKLMAVLFLAVLCFQSTPAQEIDPLENYKKAFAGMEEQQAELLLLGTFHFKDAGLDGYKPQHDINIMSEEKQEELEEMMKDLQAFNPTKIAIEVRKENQAWVDSIYREYLDGNFKLKANEIYQIAFRLGKLLGHERLYAVDARARGFKEMEDKDYHEGKQEYYFGKASKDQIAYEQELDSAFFRMYSADDELKTRVPLKTFFKYKNHPDRLRAGHGHYVNGTFKMGEGSDYYGPDSSIWWYTRNMRIFHNLLQLKEPGDRIMLLIGAGHVPIIDFQADASFDFEVIPVAKVLK